MGGYKTASEKFTRDWHINIPATPTLNIEVTRAFGCSVPEYRRKLGEQRAAVNDDWSTVVRIEAPLCVICSTVVTLSWLFVECVAAGAIVDFVGEGRGSHYWGHPGTVYCFHGSF